MYDLEHKALFDSIRAAKPINNGDYGCLSTMLAISAQMAIYTGQEIPWTTATSSKRSFALAKYALDVEPPLKPEPDGRYPTAMQGKAEYERWQFEAS